MLFYTDLFATKVTNEGQVWRRSLCGNIFTNVDCLGIFRQQHSPYFRVSCSEILRMNCAVYWSRNKKYGANVNTEAVRVSQLLSVFITYQNRKNKVRSRKQFFKYLPEFAPSHRLAFPLPCGIWWKTNWLEEDLGLLSIQFNLRINWIIMNNAYTSWSALLYMRAFWNINIMSLWNSLVVRMVCQATTTKIFIHHRLHVNCLTLKRSPLK